MPFSEVLDQPAAVAYLQKSVRGRVPQALLFCGPSGVGKRKAALEFAKALNCLDKQARQKGDGCGTCAHCREIEQAISPDVVVVDFLYQARLELKKEPSDKSYEEELEKELAKQQHIKVDTVRDITARSQQKSATGGWKILIIDEAQSMQAEAANALLKFIEEPPQKTVWILLTDKKEAMLKTILSRCQALQFAPLPDQTIEKLLPQVYPDVQDPALAARYGQGSLTRAALAAEALEILQEAEQGPAWPMAVASSLPRTLAQSRRQAQAILDIVLLALHRKWLSATETERISLQELLKKIENYKQAIGRNVSPALVVETALMRVNRLQLPIF